MIDPLHNVCNLIMRVINNKDCNKVKQCGINLVIILKLNTFSKCQTVQSVKVDDSDVTSNSALGYTLAYRRIEDYRRVPNQRSVIDIG